MAIVLFYFGKIAIAIHPEVAKPVATRFATRRTESPKNGKFLTFLRLTNGVPVRVSGVENPCVGGSIPPQPPV
jgi:hypothetical protein